MKLATDQGMKMNSINAPSFVFFFLKNHLAMEEQSLTCTCHKSTPTYFGKLKYWMKKGRPEHLRIFCSLDCTERSQE